MKPSTHRELQRQSLRLKLQANRLNPTIDSRKHTVDSSDVFPRSLTMRLLSNAPGFAIFIATEIAPFFVDKFIENRNKSNKS